MTGRVDSGGAAVVAALSIGVFLAYPTAIGSGVNLLEDRKCLTATCDPALESAVDRVDDQLAARMGDVGDGSRRDLAKTIVTEANAAGIDPLLVLAVIEVESSYDPAAVSHRGARGLMQLLEPTMRQVLERGGIDYGDPHDPVLNVQAGIRYLHRLLVAFGREDLALMAYNAGPNRILGYVRSGAIPDRFRAYPRRVQAELRRLRRAAGDPDAPLVAEVLRPRADG